MGTTEHGRVRAASAAEHAAADHAAPTLSPPAPRPAPVGGLTVGHAEDPAEHAADRAADAALARLRRLTPPGDAGSPDAGAPDPHRHDGACGHLRRAPAPTPTATPQVGMAGGALDAGTSAAIRSRVGAGSALPEPVRERMETAFGTSLGHVRVHDDDAAARLSATLSAAAFTTGRDIFLGGGVDASGADGERVLAHEIAHVLAEPGGVRRLAVKNTKINEVPLVAEVGADFADNHLAPDLESAKTLSKSVARLARTAKNTVVIGTRDAVRTALADADFKNPGPIPVPGLTWVKITSKPNTARRPEDVTEQVVENGTAPIKVKTRLVADDAQKLTTSPTTDANGPVVLATGVQG